MNIELNISDFIPNYPDIHTDNFYQTIYQKKEFFENRFIDNDNEMEESEHGHNDYKPMKHQLIGARYISQHTPYDRLPR